MEVCGNTNISNDVDIQKLFDSIAPEETEGEYPVVLLLPTNQNGSEDFSLDEFQLENPLKDKLKNCSELHLEQFNAYPNPAADFLTIEFNGDAEPTIIEMVDVTGKSVYKQIVNNFDGVYKNAINLDGIPSGPLFLYILQGQKAYTQSIIVK